MFVLRTIWVVMMATVVMYGMVGYFVIKPSMVSHVEVQQSLPSNPPPAQDSGLQTEPLDPEKFRLLVMGFGVMSTLMGVASVILRKKLVSEEVILKGLRRRDGSQDSTREALKDAEAEGSQQPIQVAAAKTLFPGYVVSWALSEAVAIHGFTLSQMIHKPAFYFWFGVPSLALLILNRPRQLLVDDAVRRFQAGAGMP